jgi:hypothetical protein
MRGTPFRERQKFTVCVSLVLGDDHGLFFHLKSLVYLTRPGTFDNLKENICAAPRQVTSQTSQHVQCIVQHRINWRERQEEHQFENLLRQCFPYAIGRKGHYTEYVNEISYFENIIYLYSYARRLFIS